MKRFVFILLLIFSISLSGADQMDRIADKSDQANTINIKDNSFQPSTLTVPAGTAVTWHNQDGVQHTVSSDKQDLFDSGPLAPGKRYTFTFSNPGSYKYHCSIHPGMRGLVVVTGSAATKASGSELTKMVSLPSSLQESAPGSEQEVSGNAGKAFWSEKPLSLSGGVLSAGIVSGGMQGTSSSKSLQLNPNGAVDQNGSQASRSQSDLQQFSQYYRSTSQAPTDQLTAPTKIDLTGEEPAMLYFGSTQKAVPYSQYENYALTTGVNSLWIQGASSWTQYAMVPLGSMITMITTSPAGGNGYLYEVYPDGTLDKNGYYFYPYNQMGFYADEAGQHQLFFNLAGQPSNVIVIDVVPYQSPAQPVYSYAAVTISSSWLRGYDVSVDGSYLATEGWTGESDGIVTINVPGNQYHTISVNGDGFTFSDYKYFNAGYAYSLNV
jgi:plastocyanin